ncbi:hypothetical protein BU25DRAFT_426644 [Macroventuria anomochaeta]|uniref:Uncharacterized protein n=1 Tax=Macroventuria anomochaeta TaxID=301207 RepID=A0ACB6RJT7_9PLEO|nr:uncharacterized protein BU25DRAFT_426644 [Macroventuria anomochaeta]KAF2621247.1 hypothetical protein BU25DRAFT_426644 [Macroventuria anomochaeta]
MATSTQVLIPTTMMTGTIIKTSILVSQVSEYDLLQTCAEPQVSTIVRDMVDGCEDGSRTTSYACFCYTSSKYFNDLIARRVSTACSNDLSQTVLAMGVFWEYCEIGAINGLPTAVLASVTSGTSSAIPSPVTTSTSQPTSGASASHPTSSLTSSPSSIASYTSILTNTPDPNSQTTNYRGCGRGPGSRHCADCGSYHHSTALRNRRLARIRQELLDLPDSGTDNGKNHGPYVYYHQNNELSSSFFNSEYKASSHCVQLSLTLFALLQPIRITAASTLLARRHHSLSPASLTFCKVPDELKMEISSYTLISGTAIEVDPMDDVKDFAHSQQIRQHIAVGPDFSALPLQIFYEMNTIDVWESRYMPPRTIRLYVRNLEYGAPWISFEKLVAELRHFTGLRCIESTVPPPTRWLHSNCKGTFATWGSEIWAEPHPSYITRCEIAKERIRE